MTDAERIVVVGAGLAGGSAAVTLRNEGFRGRIVLIGDEPHVPYGRPPLSKTYLRGEEDLSGWYVKPAQWYEQNDVEIRTLAPVRRVDTAKAQLLLDSGEEIGYDRLILCTGGHARKPDVPGINLPGVHLLRTVADCDAIKRAARPGSNALVVGMGFIGSEVAASLSQLGLHVTAVMSGASPLQGVLGETVGAVMAAIHEDHGIDLLPNDRVIGFEGSGALERAVTKQGRRPACDLAVLGVGIEPNVAPLATSDIVQDDGIVVDAQCRTSAKGVYAAGDVANHNHPLFGRVRVEHYNNAEKMGAAVARSVLGDAAPYAYVHTFWSDQYDDKLEYVGHAKHWDSFVVRGDIDERRFLGFYLERGILRAAVGLNRGGDPELDEDSELRDCAELIARQVSLEAAILADENVPVRDLVTHERGPGPALPGAAHRTGLGSS
jgi:3-phenylpropionate/trans-cinnamate dioxygenase ferredoxin reductase subunit